MFNIILLFIGIILLLTANFYKKLLKDLWYYTFNFILINFNIIILSRILFSSFYLNIYNILILSELIIFIIMYLTTIKILKNKLTNNIDLLLTYEFALFFNLIIISLIRLILIFIR